MKPTQPSNSCNTPSAIRVPQRSTVIPMMPMRMLFIATVSGMLDRGTR